MISCLHDHFLDDQLLLTPHLYFLYFFRLEKCPYCNVCLRGAARMKPALQMGGDFYDSFGVAGV